MVAIDAGHGGCLDWGVPDPSERGAGLRRGDDDARASRERLRDLLVADGIGVVMIRDEDEALAGDDYPPLDCHGPPWRDVNGDGVAGFGPDCPRATRTRDELQARLDVANLAGADALVSIHINSPTEGGQRGRDRFQRDLLHRRDAVGRDRDRARWPTAIQAGVVDQLDELATYERGDRGITAHNFYMVAPPLFEPTARAPGPGARSRRAAASCRSS